MKKSNAITHLFLDIGGVLLTDGWDHHARKRAATNFELKWAEIEARHHLIFATYEEGKFTLEDYLDLVISYKKQPFTRARYGEAETGSLATAWQSNKLLNPISDGAVLPILHLNGYNDHVKLLEDWMKSYKAEELFDENGRLHSEPDLVMGCCGDTPTLETLAAVSILHKNLPDLKIRVVNVVDLMKLQPKSEHPHGLSETDYDSLFTKDKHIIFNFHGYPCLVHRLTYRRTNQNMHVREYKEEGTITTAFDMRVQNDIDRFHLVQTSTAASGQAI